MNPDLTAQALRWFIGAAVFDEATLQLTRDGHAVALEPKPAQVLLLLLRKHNEVLTLTELREQVWGNRPTVANVISTAIGKVRHALADIPEIEIASVARIGYRLTGPVRPVQVNVEVPEPAPARVGDRVGDFRLIGRLGDGPDMLWRALADDSPALLRIAQTESGFLRLRQEWGQALALQQTLGDRPELLLPTEANLAEAPFYLRYPDAGPTLSGWASTHLHKLDPAERLSLFLAIAEPLAALHNAGFLHQALNADNVLISGTPGNWQPRLSNIGQRQRVLPAAGTDAESAATWHPADAFYLAPEQLHGAPCTISSEVHASGVLLYQLLIGDLQRAVHPGWEREVADELLRLDIAAATDHDAARRIGSVHALIQRLRQLDERRAAAELQRRQSAEREATEAREARQRARRPWMLTAAALLVGCTLLAGWLYLEADRRRAAAERLAQSNETVQRFLVEDVFVQTNPADPRYRRDASMLDVLDNAAANIDARYAADPLTLGILHRAIGSSYKALDHQKSSIAHYRASIPLLESELGAASEAALSSRYSLAHAFIFSAEFDAARAELDIADQRAGDLLTRNDPIALRSAVYRGQLHTHQFQPDKALANYERAQQLMDAGVFVSPEFAPVVRHERADALLRLDRNEEAIALLAPITEFQTDGLRAGHHRLLARAYRAKGDYHAALPHAELAVSLYRSFDGENDSDTLKAMSSLSYLQFLLGNCEAAVPLAEEAYRRMATQQDQSSQNILIELGNLGSRRADCGQPDLGIQDLYTARNQLREHYGATNPPAQSFAMILATHLGNSQRHDEALEVVATLSADAAAQIQASGGPSVKPATLQVLHARLLHGAGRSAEALPLLSSALAVLEAPDNTDTKLRDEARELRAAVCEASAATCVKSHG